LGAPEPIGPGLELLLLVVGEGQHGLGATAFIRHMSPLFDYTMKPGISQG
jgi:hypothetical protein